MKQKKPKARYVTIDVNTWVGHYLSILFGICCLVSGYGALHTSDGTALLWFLLGLQAWLGLGYTTKCTTNAISFVSKQNIAIEGHELHKLGAMIKVLEAWTEEFTKKEYIVPDIEIVNKALETAGIKITDLQAVIMRHAIKEMGFAMMNPNTMINLELGKHARTTSETSTPA